MRAVKFEDLRHAIEILAGIGRILEIGEMLDAREHYIVQRRRKFADARQELVEIGASGGSRQWREALARLIDHHAFRGWRPRGLVMGGAEGVEVRRDAAATGLDDGFE